MANHTRRTMKIAVVVLVGLCALVAASPVGTGSSAGRNVYTISDKVQLQRQRDIFRLFRYVNQPYYHFKDQNEIAKSYSIESNIGLYTNETAVRQFLHWQQVGPLPRGEVFSVFDDYQLEQAIALFNVFYYAKDYDTFYRTAVYVRNQVNEGIYLYALSVAIIHRPDTVNIILPPIYEVYPYYFFNSEVIQRAQQFKQQYLGQQEQQTTGGYSGFTVPANYSSYHHRVNPEQSLAYYTEDIGINALYFYYNLYYPFWLPEEQSYVIRATERRGERYYFLHQQLLARYYLERLSNDLGEIPYLDYEQPLVGYGYQPSLRYPNGEDFPVRPNYVRLSDYFYNYGHKFSSEGRYGYSYTLVQARERRIRDAIDAGFITTRTGEQVNIYTPGGFEILADLIESNPESRNPQYYGGLQEYGRHLLGYSYQEDPSALEHFETSLRDPAFYLLYKKIVLFFQSYKARLQPYANNELVYPGVRIESVSFDRLVTYFDYYDADITNAVYVTQQEFEHEYEGNNYFQVRARQQRLNHKPFSYRINVSSEAAGESIVKVYIGPKYNEHGREIDINENRVNFVLFDYFSYSLQAGKNVIERNSQDATSYVPDRISFQQLYQRVSSALNGEGQFQVDASEASFGFPQRYRLPKGTYGGQTFQIYAIVVPVNAPKTIQVEDSHHVDNIQQYYPRVPAFRHFDSYPLGYPFDRIIDETEFHVPNSYVQDVNIYYRNYEDINASTHHDSENEVSS